MIAVEFGANVLIIPFLFTEYVICTRLGLIFKIRVNETKGDEVSEIASHYTTAYSG